MPSRPHEVFQVETYELVRRAVLVDGLSEREASREFGVNRRTVRKMVEIPVPPGYRVQEPRRKPKMDGFLPRIEAILKEDESAPRKQRHTAKRVWERLREEFGYKGGPCQVRRAVKALRERPKEAFVPLVSLPGEAEADFGESLVEIAGRRVKGHAFTMVLPLTGVWFMQVYPAENAESFCHGHMAAFRFFCGVPRRVVYDNPSYAVKRDGKPLTGRERTLAEMFSELCSVCLMKPEFAAPRRGNEKGSVERKVGVLRSSLMVPVPKAGSFEELNERLLSKALAHKEECEPLALETLLPLPDYEPGRLASASADKLSLVRFDCCSYSVPTRLAGTQLLIRATPFSLDILSSKEMVASHARCYEKGRIRADLAHYIDLLERKPRAARAALPVLQAGLPDVFESYRQEVEDGTGVGDRKFVAVLRLSVDFGPERVAAALRKARALGLKEPADIRLVMLKEAEDLPRSLCSVWKLPDGRKAPAVERPPLGEYGRLLAGGAR